MRVRYAGNVAGARADGFLHASRGIALAQESGVVGRAWQAGTVTAEVDLEHAADYPLLAAARAAALLSAGGPSRRAGGGGGGGGGGRVGGGGDTPPNTPRQHAFTRGAG